MNNLEKQLRELGVNANEAEKLSRTAKQLKSTALPQLSPHARAHIRGIPGSRWQLHMYKFAAGGAAAVFIGLIFVSQSALPGSWLYGLKRGTDHVRAFIQTDTETETTDSSDELHIKTQEKISPAPINQTKQPYEQTIEPETPKTPESTPAQDKKSPAANSSQKQRRNTHDWWNLRHLDSLQLDLRFYRNDRR